MLVHKTFCGFTLILLCRNLWPAHRGEVHTLSHCNANNRARDQAHPSFTLKEHLDIDIKLAHIILLVSKLKWIL